MEFADGLTCIIGARGTCKSTLIESIRFAFELDRHRVATLVKDEEEGDVRAPTFGIIKHTLRAGSVRCAIAEGGSSVTVEREVGAEPRIFVDGVREHTNRDLLHGIEIFSQGDLQRIAEDENDDLRLALIDRPHRKEAARLKQERARAAEDLSRLGPQLRTVRAKLSTLEHEITQLKAARGQLERLEKESPAASPELEEERRRHEQRERRLDEIRSVEAERAAVIEQLVGIRPRARRTAEAIATLTSEEEASLEDGRVQLTQLAEALGDLVEAGERVEAVPLPSFIESLERRFEEESELYYTLRQREQAVNEVLKQQQVLRKQIEHLEVQRGEAEAARTEESKLLKQRKALREDLGRIDDALYEMRIAEVDSINIEHGDTVQLTLGSSWNSRAYSERLTQLLSGSRIRSQDEVARSIAESIEPSSLVDLTETGDAQRLADLLGRDLGQMTRVIAHLGDHPELYALETALPAARLEITLFDEGEPKPVETLSKGQRATALLPIILRPLPYPLLFDQPEDDLDNSFIIRSLIRTLRHVKTQRQLIFVTHNANIPVLGGAEKVVVMRMDSPTKAAVPLMGSVESRKQEILDLLEGGAEAFIERERYYGDLVADLDGSEKRHPVDTERS